MSKNWICRAAYTAAFFASVSCADGNQTEDVEKSEQDKDRPNVLVLLFDDMRFDTFSYRDGPVSTPNIDALAKEGTQFNNAMTTTGLCSPSRAALFTGRWGHKNGLDDNIYLFHSRKSELPPEQGGAFRASIEQRLLHWLCGQVPSGRTGN